MKYYSTRDKYKAVSLREAVINGLAEDGGLYLPENIPQLAGEYFTQLEKRNFQEMGLDIARMFVGDEIPEAELQIIVNDSINFPAPVKHLFDNYFALELFHGPTLAFKDFGARFMARLLGYFVKGMNKDLHILVATSGDTGSAVANGFYNVDGIKVHLLYPKGRVSSLQEKQLTTYGGNITALEVKGSFDDCQRLVKSAFRDNEINKSINISSANSINIARLLPQSFYYFNAFSQLQNGKEIVFTVPSGNLGNLTAGIIAKKTGLPVKKFIAATNRNDVYTAYLETGKFASRSSVKTISNAMDVGDPSNFERLLSLYSESHSAMLADISSSTFNDEETKSAIREVYGKCGYFMDPHGAVGYLAAKAAGGDVNHIILETAHPAKFSETVEEVLGVHISLPKELEACMEGEKKTIPLDPEFEDFKQYLLELA